MTRRSMAARVGAGVLALGVWGGAAHAGQAPGAPAPPSGRGGAVQVETPPPAETPPLPSGVIAGRIVDVSTKTPIHRARVRLSAGCELPSTGDTPCTRVLEFDRVEVTDEQGRYRFSGLPPGKTYLVTASATGYAAQGAGELPPGLRPAFVPLAAGQVWENINIELAAEVVLAGVVHDENGKPFAGALVEALRATYIDGRRELFPVAQMITDDRGQFRLSQMAPGQYYVSAMDPAFTNVGDAQGQLFWPQTFYPSATTPEDATRITLDPGVTQEQIIIQLKLIRPARVGGRLRTATNEELTAGAIELGPRLADQNMSLSNHQVDIKPDGTYVFANVLPGSYAIRARGEAPTIAQSMFGVYVLDVSGVDRMNTDILMQPGAIVGGFVQWDGRSRKPGPEEKSMVVIRAPLVDGSLSGDAVTGNVQPNDSFRLRGVLQGPHYIRPEGLPEPWTLKRVELRGADVTDIPVDFSYGQIEESLRVILTDSSGEITGTVKIGPYDVMHGYAVVAFSVNPTSWHPRSRHVQITRPNHRGNFLMRGFPAGEYFLAVTRDIDEGDVGNAAALERLSRAPGVLRVSIRDGERRAFDVRAIPRTELP